MESATAVEVQYEQELSDMKVLIDNLVSDFEKKYTIPNEKQVVLAIETFSPLHPNRFIVGKGVQINVTVRDLVAIHNSIKKDR